MEPPKWKLQRVRATELRSVRRRRSSALYLALSFSTSTGHRVTFKQRAKWITPRVPPPNALRRKSLKSQREIQGSSSLRKRSWGSLVSWPQRDRERGEDRDGYRNRVLERNKDWNYNWGGGFCLFSTLNDNHARDSKAVDSSARREPNWKLQLLGESSDTAIVTKRGEAPERKAWQGKEENQPIKQRGAPLVHVLKYLFKSFCLCTKN